MNTATTPIASASSLDQSDNTLARLIQKEGERQRQELNLIASENIASAAVMAAQGSVLTNKYAEGYPSKRWYHGCDVVDEIERIGQERACKLFGCTHANLQPHSGANANLAAYFSLVKPGDRVMAMDLAHGGHLTHGSTANFSGKLFEIIPYGVNEDNEQLDYDQIRDIALRQKPHLIVAGASNYSRTLHFETFSEIANECGARLMVDMAHICGLVAAGVHPSPIPYADIVTTTTHKTFRGPRGGMILAPKELSRKINSQVFPGIQGGPLMHTIAAKAVALGEALTEHYRRYQELVVANAQALAQKLQDKGWRIVSGGTDNHLFTVDVGQHDMSGAQAADLLQKVGIVVNKNALPNDTRKITETSGIRMGTPLITSRGLTVDHMDQVADWIHQTLSAPTQEAQHQNVAHQVKELCQDLSLVPV